MSKIEERVASIRFDNSKFSSGVRDTLNQMRQLKDGMKFKDAGEGLSKVASGVKNLGLRSIAQDVSNISGQFSKLGIAGSAALATIASRATLLGADFLKSFTVAPLMDGFREYELKMGSIQTILANNQRHGTGLAQVKASLEELNTYADKTIYNFGDMTKNIGLFTNSGMKVEEATSVIKGFSNAAAASGTDSMRASGAAYQLSQALSAGKIQLMDWNSLQNAGMGNKNMQLGLMDIAKAMGTLSKSTKIGQKGQKSFRDSLRDGWLTADVMSKYLQIMAGDISDAQMKAMGLTATQVKSFREQQKTAEEAATKVRTFTQLIQTTKEALGSVWAKSFELLIGDFDGATNLFSAVADRIANVTDAFDRGINGTIKRFVDAGGRSALIEGLGALAKTVGNLLRPVGQAFSEVFGSIDNGGGLAKAAKGFAAFAKGLELVTRDASNLKGVFKAVFAVLHLAFTVVGGAVRIVAVVLGFLIEKVLFGVFQIGRLASVIGEWVASAEKAVVSGRAFAAVMSFLAPVIRVVTKGIKAIAAALPTKEEAIRGVNTAIDYLIEKYRRAVVVMTPFVNRVRELVGAFREWSSDSVKKIADSLEDFGEAVAQLSKDTGSKSMAVYRASIEKLGPPLERAKKLLSEFKAEVLKVGPNLKGMGSQAGNTGKAVDGMMNKFRDDEGESGGGGGFLGTVRNALSWIGTKIKETFPLLQKFGSTIQNAAKWGKEQLQMIFKDFDATDYQGVFNLAALTAVGLRIHSFMSTLEKAIKAGSGIGKSFADTLSGLGNALNSFALKTKAQALLLAAAAVAIFAGSLLLLSLIPQSKLTTSIGAMATLTIQMVALMVALGSMSDKMGSVSSVKLVAIGLALLGFAVALSFMALAVAKLAKIDLNGLIRGLVGLGVMMGMITGMMLALRTMNPKAALANALALVLVAIALNGVASSFRKFAELSWESILKGVITLGTVMAILAVALRAMPPQGAAMGVAIGGALVGIALALMMISALPIALLIKSVVTIGLLMGILAVSMMVMSKGAGGAAVIIAMAAAMNMLVVPLLAFGNMKWSTIGKGLLVIAAMMVIFTVAIVGMVAAFAALGVAAGPIALLGAALIVLGLGLLLVSLSIKTFVLAFVALTTTIVASGAALLLFLQGLIAMLPALGTAIGLFLGNLVLAVLQMVPGWVAALGIIIQALLKVFINIQPSLAAALNALIATILNVLVTSVPRIVVAAMQMALGILRGIRDNIPQIVAVGIQIVIRLLAALQTGMGPMADKGAKLIISAIRAMSTSLDRNAPALRSAMKQLGISMIKAITGGLDPASAVAKALSAGKAIVSGLTKGIRDKASEAVEAAKGVASRVAGAIPKVLKINSPSKVVIPYGEAIPEGLAVGIGSAAPMAVRAASVLALAVSDAVDESMNLVDGDMTFNPTITPVVDLTAAKKGFRELDTMATKSFASGAASDFETSKIGAVVPAKSETIVHNETKNYTQHNHSPKALSALDIYRQTKMQLLTGG